jgi:hypothetical protein
LLHTRIQERACTLHVRQRPPKSMRALHPFLAFAAKAAIVGSTIAMVGMSFESHAFSASPGSLTGRTNKNGGTGCAGCHAADGGLSVALSGPTSMPVRSFSSFTLTAAKGGVGSGVKMGMAAAASGGTLSTGSIYLTRVDPAGEIIHSALGGSGGTLQTTNAAGTAAYSFSFRIPDDAVVGSTYTIYALARLGGAHGWAHAANHNITVTANSPPAPTIGAVSAGNAQAMVNFTAPSTNGGSPITSYTVTSSPGGFTATGMASPITVTGLNNGTAYTFNVYASNAIGDGFASAASAAVTPGAPPGAPLNVVATPGNSNASVAFSPPASSGTAGVTSYTVTASPGGASATGMASPLQVTGLTNGAPYTFTITATSLYGTGPPSVPSNAVTPQPFPGAPANLMAVAGNGQVTLSFAAANDGGSPITGYLVTVTPNAGTDTAAGTTALTRTITGLTNATQYSFMVTALNAFGSGPASNSVTATPFAGPGAPVSVFASAASGGASVSFGAAAANGSAVTGYTVISNPPGGVDTNAGQTLLNHTMSNLINGVSYTFTVVATNASGQGPASAPSNAVVPGAEKAPRVVWTQLLKRGDGEQANCGAPVAQRGPPMDAAGNPFVNGCSLQNNGNYDVVTHKLDGGNGTVLWTATHTNFVIANSYPLSHALVGNPSGHVTLVSNTRNPLNFNDAVRLVKYNGATGQVLWTADDPSATLDEAVIDTTADASGNMFTVGDGGNGIHLVKYNGTTGAKLWHQNTERYAKAMVVDGSGNVIITGSVLTNNRDFRVVKYNGATGAVLWDSSWSSTPGGTYDSPRAMALDASGNVFVAGDSLPGTVVVKFDGATGTPLWAAFAPSAQWVAIATDGAGNALVTGSSNDPVGGYNMRSAKINGANGTEIWNVAYNAAGNNSDFSSAIAIDAQGNAVVTGSSRDTATNQNMRVIKHKGSDGSIVWSHAYLSSYTDSGLRVAITPDNSVIVVGEVQLENLIEGTLVQKLADVVPPGAPQNVTATGVPGGIRLNFSAPASDGGAHVSSYTANCGGASVTASTSPIIVSGLMAGTLYGCTVSAANYAGSGPDSAQVSTMPLTAIALVGAVSRKVHGAAGALDLPLTLNVPLASNVSVEPRAMGAGHQVVFKFDGPVNQPGSASMMNAAGMQFGSATPVANGTEVIVTLSGVVDATRAAVNLTGVNGSLTASVALGFLLGDVNGSRTVDATDLTATRALSGSTVTQNNFRHDVNLTGMIGAADVAAVKSRSTRSLP